MLCGLKAEVKAADDLSEFGSIRQGLEHIRAEIFSRCFRLSHLVFDRIRMQLLLGVCRRKLLLLMAPPQVQKHTTT